MKLNRATATISCLTLIFAGLIVWRFVRTELSNRQLAKQAAAYRNLAEQGDAESQSKLGSMYYRGKGVPTDFGEAVRWYRKSAEQGYAKAEYNLSHMYFEGKGVPQDFREAERWRRKAAEQGDARAEEGLGFMYYRGEGVRQDYGEAAHWYRKSAEQGDSEARYVLGYMYLYGYGVPQDRSEADRLFRQAAAQGNEDAKRALGLNTVRCSTITKIMLPFKFLAGLLLGVVFLKSGQGHRTRVQLTTGVAALVIICSVALDSFWYFYAGYLQSPAIVTVLYLVRHLLSGAIVGLLAAIVHEKSAKIVLIAAAAIFVGFVTLEIVHAELRHLPIRVWFLCFAGLPIGMSIPSGVFLWLDRKSENARQLQTYPTAPA